MTKTIYITGATSGFGEACVRLFAGEGWRLVLTGRRAKRLARLKSELGGEIHTIVQDVRDRQSVERDLDELPGPFREIDVLVTNAGLALGMEPAQEANLDQWERMIDTNIKGLVYCTTKAFVKQFSFNLLADVLGTAVRVTNIEPGLADTDFSEIRFNGDREKADRVYAGMKPLTAEDIAGIVHWAVSQPPHVNINRVEVMPVSQSCGPFAIHRDECGKLLAGVIYENHQFREDRPAGEQGRPGRGRGVAHLRERG